MPDEHWYSFAQCAPSPCCIQRAEMLLIYYFSSYSIENRNFV
jgi:hypothetical protein